MIDRATVQKITDTADIVEVVSDYVHLIRRGSNYMGLCPFHNERTPSFSVNRKRNFCYCFSCKKGGSPVNFIMEKEGLSYREALLHLAKKYGIEVREKELSDEERERQSAREAMLVANEWSMQLMEKDLTDTEEGKDVGLSYFNQRGVTPEARKAFHLGYALDNGHHLVDEATKAGFDINVLKTLGLVGTSQNGRDYDRFRGRVIFPILGNSGKVIAFGGRDLKGGLAKYINSPESELYKKSNELYGIFQARPTIVREDKCYLVEGYMDVIGMWQSGMKNVVASSGTALTDGQIAMIHRLTQNITLIYDGDAAGIKASLRGIDMLLSHKMNVKVLLLPDNDDPDSFARKHTPDEFRQYVADHETDIIRFKVEVLSRDCGDDPQKRVGVINSVAESIAHIGDPVSRDVYIQECARMLKVSEESVAKAVGYMRNDLIQKLKKAREWSQRDGENVTTDNTVVSSATDPRTAPESRQENPPAKQQKITTQPLSSYPFMPLEARVLKYCLRYGYLDFCEAEEEDGSKTTINVLDYVLYELEPDGIVFSVPVFAKIITLLQKIRPDFEAAYATRRTEIDAEIDTQRKKGIDEIGRNASSVQDIRKREQKLEEKLNASRLRMTRDFVKGWPSMTLRSHEDDEVRSIVFRLSHEKHQLSAIYTKEAVFEPEEDRLESLVPRAINEWKGEILNARLKDLLMQFHDNAGKMDMEEEEKLQLKINSIIKLRQKLAKDIGDRTLSARKMK